MLKVDQTYVLLLVDLKGSTAMPAAAREPLFERLEEVIGRWNRRRKDRAELPISLAYGDEVAALFDRVTLAGDLLGELRSALAPEGALRFAVVRGKIGRESRDIRQVGGDVFKRASAAIDQLKRSRGFGAWQVGDELENATLEALTTLVFATLENMTPWQREVYQALAAGRTQVEIAESTGRAQQSISDAARRGGAAHVIAAEQVLARWWEKLDRVSD